MNSSRLVVTVTRTVGLTLLNHGVVTLATSGVDEGKVAKRAFWQRGARRVFGDAVDAPAFAVAEVAVGAVLIIVVPRLLRP